MSNPLSFIPMAMAAGGGRMRSSGAEWLDSAQLVAAGITLLQRSAPLVRALAGRRSAILLPTSPAFVTALAASDGRGAVLINPLAAPAEIAFQCTDADVGAVFTSSAFVPRLPAGLPYVLLDDSPRAARVVTPDRTHDVDLGSHHGLSVEGESTPDGSDEEFAVVYTSAMRGTPLGARLTHRNLLANARSTIEATGMRADDHVIALLPYAHLFGLTVTGVAPMLLGARVTALDRFNPRSAADLVADGVTMVIGVPAVYHALLSAIERRGIDLGASALRLCLCGGAHLPRELQDRWADVTGMELREGYGLTEAGPVCLVNRYNKPNVRGTMGEPLPGMRVEVLAESFARDGGPPTPVADETPGEICVFGANVFAGYVGNKDGLTVRDGWLASGDEAIRHADGTIEFLGLIKPMFTRNGFNVYPREIERVIARMPGVEEVVVTPIPEPTKENDIHVGIRGSVTDAEVKAWCESRLSAYKQPTVIEIQDDRKTG